MEDVRAKYNALLAKPPPKGAPCKNMKTFLLCCALVVFLIIIMIVVSVETNKQLLPQTETCQAIHGNDPDAGPVGCRVCQQGARSNDISGLPFLNLGLKAVSHNLGVYSLVRFNGSQASTTVNPDQLLGDLVAVRGGSTPDDPGNYVQALGLYFVFAILMCVLTIVAGCSICCCKMCCNCVCCGRRYPTEKSSYLGFQFFPESNSFRYSSLGVWNTRIFMGTFAFFMALWLGLGQVNGNLGMTSSMKALTHAPDGLVSVIRGLVQPVAQLLEDLISKTFVGLFRDLNSTITTEVNLAVIIDGVECLLDLLGGFPSSGPLRNFVADLEGALYNLTLLLATRVPPALANLTGELDLVELQVTDLRDYVNGAFAERLTQLIGNLTVLQDDTDRFNNFTGQMLDPQCCATKANNDLAKLQDSSNEITEIEYQDMITRLTSIRDGAFAVTTQLVDEINKTQGVMINLPNFNNSADELVQHNLIVQTAIANGVASNLAISINETNAFLSKIQGFTDELNGTVQNLIADVGEISLDPIRDIILDFNRSSYDLPSFSIVFMFIDSVLGIKDRLFPCMYDISEQLDLFDRNVAELPQQFLEIDSIISSVNETLEPALNTIDDVKTRQKDLEESRDKFNISKQLDSLADTERELKNYTDAVSNSNYLQSVRDAEDKATLNITILPQVERVEASLPTWILPEQNISDIRVIETPRSGLNQDLPMVNQDLAQMFGRCTSNSTQSCRVDGDCDTSQTCVTSPFRGCSDGITFPCSRDSDCGPFRCLVDYDRLNRTINNLYLMQLAVYSSSSMNGITQLLKDARNASEIDTSSLEMGIVEANNSLNAVETGSLTSDLNNVITSLRDFNASDFSTQIDDINATLNDIDFASILENLNSLDGNFQSVTDAKESLDVAHQFLNATRDLFFTRLPLVIESFSTAKLREIRRTSGVSGTLQYLAERVDAETAWLDGAAGSVLLNNESSGGSFATNFTSALAPYKDLVHTICDANYGTYGSAYFLSQLASAFGSSMPGIFEPDGTEDKVDKNNAGQPYPGGATCITTTCLENTIDWINSAPLSEVSGGLLPVNLSRQEVIGLPYLVPLFIMICATISALLFCKSSTAGWWSSCLATCTCYGAFCCMPLIFLFVGMAFPLVIVSGDICYSVENIGYNALSQQGPEMCNSLSGSGPITNCVIPWSFRNESHNATVNILGTYAALVAPGCDPNSGAIYDAFEQAKDAFSKMPRILIANFVNNDTNVSNGLPINFRWPIKQIFVDAADDLSIHTRSFGTGLQRALSCSQLYTVYSSFKGAVCCDVVSAFYWALGSWYLIAWTLLCCGCCAGLLGRKRFAYELWGDEYVQLKDKAFVAREVGDDDPQGKRLSESENGQRDSVGGNPVFVAAPQPAHVPEPEYVAPPTYQPAYDVPAPAYDSSGMESKGDVEMELVSAPSAHPAKTIEDF